MQPQVGDHLKPPHSADAEHGVIGAILKDPEAALRVMEILNGEEFYYPNHRTIFGVIRSLTEKGEPADITTVSNALQTAGTLVQAGGRIYLVEMVEAVPSSAHVKKYAEIVRDKFLHRQLIESLTEFTRAAYEQSESPHSLASKVYGRTGQIMTGRTEAEMSARTLYRAVKEEIALVKSDQTPAAYKYGLKSLDELTGGFNDEDFIVWAALPKVGKTSALVDIAIRGEEQGRTILFITAEMSIPQIARRFICNLAGVDITSWKRKTLTEEDIAKIEAAEAKISKWPLHIICERSMDVDRLVFVARRYIKEHGISEVYIDFLQKLSTTFRGDRYEKLNYIVDTLQRFQSNANVPTHVGCQINRKGDKGKNKPPNLSDLEGTGMIAQIANFIHIIHRPEMGDLKKKNSEKSNLRNKAEIYTYSRDGGSGYNVFCFEEQYCRFLDDSSFELPLDVTPVKAYRFPDSDDKSKKDEVSPF